MTNIAFVEDLLQGVSIDLHALRKAKVLFADRLAPDFNIFDAMRLDEMGISMCLGSLLDPRGKHGQGEVFLREFLNAFCSHWECNLKLKYLQLEKMAYTRRMDIYIQFESGEILAIENKPWAGDQRNQLQDYAAFLHSQARGQKWHLMYLSNSEPNESSIRKTHREQLEETNSYSQITYFQIVGWLERCAELAKAPSVKFYIDHFAKLLRSEVNGELDMSEQKEIMEVILQSNQHLEAAFHVQKAMHTIKEELLAKFRTDLDQRITAAGFVQVWDPSLNKGWTTYSGFGIRFRPNNNLHMRFEFQQANLQKLIWGVRRDSSSVPSLVKTWDELNRVITTKFGNGGNTRWWPWYSPVSQSALWGQEVSDWNKNFEPWMKIQSGELAEQIVSLATEMWSLLEPHQKLLSVSSDQTTSDQDSP